jgi:hypothetical protein
MAGCTLGELGERQRLFSRPLLDAAENAEEIRQETGIRLQEPGNWDLNPGA